MKPVLSVLIAAAGLLVSLAAVPAASAQEPAPLAWEPLTGSEWDSARALALYRGSDGDSLFALGRIEASGLYRLAPGDTAWSDDLHSPTGSPNFLVMTQAGTLLGGARSGPTRVDRSPDGGRTWQRLDVGEGVECLFECPSDGAILACADDPDLGLFASYDDGLTWETLGRVTAETPSVANTLAEHPTAGPGGGPRLVAGVQNGLAYSDDGGMTWHKSNVWGEFRWWGDAFALASGGSADGSDAPGTLYAAARDFNDAHAVLLASSDGGATWAERSRPGRGFPDLVALPDGSLLLAVGSEQPEAGAKMWRSFDGGRTWHDEITGYDNGCIEDLAVGSDGLAYLAGCSGVWRTTEAVPVSEEAGPPLPGAGGAKLEVYPNPSGVSAPTAVTVALTLAEAAVVRITVYDVLGREVAALHDGSLAAGEHALRLDTAGLPSGVYFLRLRSEAASLTRRLVVLR